MKVEALAQVLREMFPAHEEPHPGPLHYMHVVEVEERRMELRRRLQLHPTPEDTMDDGLEDELDELNCELGDPDES